MKLTISEKPDLEFKQTLTDKVRSYNTDILAHNDAKPLLSMAHNEQGELLGGVAGRTIYGHFLVEVVWVSESLRGQGVGSQLMNAAETVARERGCRGAQVDTLSFQGIEFYTSLGFKEVGRVKNFPEGHDRVFYHKEY